MWENFDINFNVSFIIFLEQSGFAFSWINKRLDNIKMHGKTVKIIGAIVSKVFAAFFRNLAACANK